MRLTSAALVLIAGALSTLATPIPGPGSLLEETANLVRTDSSTRTPFQSARDNSLRQPSFRSPILSPLSSRVGSPRLSLPHSPLHPHIPSPLFSPQRGQVRETEIIEELRPHEGTSGAHLTHRQGSSNRFVELKASWREWDKADVEAEKVESNVKNAGARANSKSRGLCGLGPLLECYKTPKEFKS